MADATMIRPKTARDGTVMIPTTWSILAWAVLEDEGSSQAARSLAKKVVEAAGV